MSETSTSEKFNLLGEGVFNYYGQTSYEVTYPEALHIHLNVTHTKVSVTNSHSNGQNESQNI